MDDGRYHHIVNDDQKNLMRRGVKECMKRKILSLK